MLRLSLLIGCWLTAGLLSWAGPALANQEEDRLRSLFNYRWSLSRPVRAADDVVNVTIGLTHVEIGRPQRERMNLPTFLTVLRGWLNVQWTDHRLNWTDVPAAGDVRQVRVKLDSAKAWTPSIQVLNPFDKKPSLFPPVTECVVTRSGNILVTLPVQLELQCQYVDVPGAPQYVGYSGPNQVYDCPIKFGSTLTSLELVDFRPINESNFVDAEPLTSEAIWKVTVERREIKRDCCSKPFATLEAQIMLR